MPDPFLGEIRMFAGTFAPRNWAYCNGQLLPINQNQALFSLLGTTYGGDGRTTFALPDLRGRVPVHNGASAGPGLPEVRLGERGGNNEVTLNTNQMPAHSHPVNGASANADSTSPTDNVPAVPFDGVNNEPNVYGTGTPDVTMAADVIGETGGTDPVDVRQPFLGIHYIIALQGVFPSRS